MSQNDEKILRELKTLESKLNDSHARIEKLESHLSQALALLRSSLEVQNRTGTQIERSMQQLFHPVHVGLQKVKSVANLVARNMPRSNKPIIRVVFMVHNVEAWDALNDVYDIMRNHDRFEAIVITTKRDFLNTQKFGEEEINFKGLQQLGINPIRFNGSDTNQELEFLKVINPDIIFRQSPWEISIPQAFHFNEISFARTCYVSYGFGSVKLEAEHTNIFFMRNLWRAYCETDSQAQGWNAVTPKGAVRVSGSPKLDRVLKTSENAGWPMEILPDTTRIIWAPHHSVQSDWLNFSTFMSNYRLFLQLARECPNLQIVLKPHPSLFEKIVFFRLITHDELRAYLEEFLALPNTAMVTGGNYVSLFWASDLMITDGIGFFAEYMVTGKPLIWSENPGHFPLNEIGEILQEGMYRANDFEAIVNYLEQLCVQQDDPLAAKRKEITQKLLPRPEGSAQFIVNDILEAIDSE